MQDNLGKGHKAALITSINTIASAISATERSLI